MSFPVPTWVPNGYRCLISFQANANIYLAQKGTKPPGIDGGPKIDNTTFNNNQVKTYAPQALYELTDPTIKCAYDPAVIPQIIAPGSGLINANTLVTCTFPNGGHIDFYGYLQKIDFAELVSGTQPEADVTIVCTNRDANGNESAPTYTAPSGSPTTTTTPAPITTTTAPPAP